MVQSVCGLGVGYAGIVMWDRHSHSESQQPPPPSQGGEEGQLYDNTRAGVNNNKSQNNNGVTVIGNGMFNKQRGQFGYSQFSGRIG